MPATPKNRAVFRLLIAVVVTSAMTASALVVASVSNVPKRATSANRSDALAAAPGSNVAAQPAVASSQTIEQTAIDVAAHGRELPVRDGEFDDLTRYCSPDRLHVQWSKPAGTYRHGAYIEPLGPAPDANTTQVNGIVVCEGSLYAYMGFEASKTAAGWDVIPVPDVEDDVPEGPEADGDKIDPGLVPQATPPKVATKIPAVTVVPKPTAKTLTAAIENLSGYDAQSTCSPTAKPGVLAFRALLLKTYSNTRSLGITRNCSSGGTSEHKEGRAFDWGARVNKPAERAAAQKVIDWLFAADQFGNQYAMARRLGIMYIVYNHKIWGAYRTSEGWRSYNGANPHTDHVHFSFARVGAMGKTSFWTGIVATVPGGAGHGHGGGNGGSIDFVNFRNGGVDRVKRDHEGTVDWQPRHHGDGAGGSGDSTGGSHTREHGDWYWDAGAHEWHNRRDGTVVYWDTEAHEWRKREGPSPRPTPSPEPKESAAPEPSPSPGATTGAQTTNTQKQEPATNDRPRDDRESNWRDDRRTHDRDGSGREYRSGDSPGSKHPKSRHGKSKRKRTRTRSKHRRSRRSA